MGRKKIEYVPEYYPDWVVQTDRNCEGVKSLAQLVKPVLPKIVVEKIHPDAVTPSYASEGDSGLDVYATEDILIHPGETKLMKLGFKLGIPRHPLHEFGYRWECQVRARSGVAMKTSLRVANQPGTVDNFYRGEVGVLMHNTNVTEIIQHDDTKDVAYCVENPLDLKGGQFEYWDGDLLQGTYLIRKGERFAQLVFNEVVRPLEIVEGKVDDTDRGEGGFGSSGV